MSDQSTKTDPKTSASLQGFEKAATPGFEKASAATKNVTDQALSAGRDLKEKAIGMVESSTDMLKDQASGFVDAAKEVASQAGDKFKQTVEGQKTAGAEYVGSLAETMRRAAREFDGDLPIAGVYIRKAAAQIEGVSDSIKTGNLQDLVRSAQSFARRQPTAFLGLAVLAGFGAVRFLKSSANDTSSQSGSYANTFNAAGHSTSRHNRTASQTGQSEGSRNDFAK